MPSIMSTPATARSGSLTAPSTPRSYDGSQTPSTDLDAASLSLLRSASNDPSWGKVPRRSSVTPLTSMAESPLSARRGRSSTMVRLMHGADLSMSVRLDGVGGGHTKVTGRRLKRMGRSKGKGPGDEGREVDTEASKSSSKFNIGTVRRGIDEILVAPGSTQSQPVVRFAAMLRHCLDDLDDLRAEYDNTRAGQHEKAPGSPIRRLAGEQANASDAGGKTSTVADGGGAEDDRRDSHAAMGPGKSKSKRSRRESSYGSVRADRGHLGMRNLLTMLRRVRDEPLDVAAVGDKLMGMWNGGNTGGGSSGDEQREAEDGGENGHGTGECDGDDDRNALPAQMTAESAAVLQGAQLLLIVKAAHAALSSLIEGLLDTAAMVNEWLSFWRRQRGRWGITVEVERGPKHLLHSTKIMWRRLLGRGSNRGAFSGSMGQSQSSGIITPRNVEESIDVLETVLDSHLRAIGRLKHLMIAGTRSSQHSLSSSLRWVTKVLGEIEQTLDLRLIDGMLSNDRVWLAKRGRVQHTTTTSPAAATIDGTTAHMTGPAPTAQSPPSHSASNTPRPPPLLTVESPLPAIESPPLSLHRVAAALHVALVERWPSYRALLGEAVGDLRPASLWRRNWPRWTALALGTAYGAWFLANEQNRKDIGAWLAGVRRSANEFWVEHVVEPTAAISQELLHGRNMHIQDEIELRDTLQSLENMLDGFMERHTKDRFDADERRQMAKRHDMTVVSENFEKSLPDAVKSLVSGQLVEIMLIQFQFIKKELMVAMGAMDKLIAKNELNMQVMAIMPATAAVYGSLYTVRSLLLSIFRSASQRQFDKPTTLAREMKGILRDIDRLLNLRIHAGNDFAIHAQADDVAIDLARTNSYQDLAALGESGGGAGGTGGVGGTTNDGRLLLGEYDTGQLLLLLHRLGLLFETHRSFFREGTQNWLEQDLADLLGKDHFVQQQLNTVARMYRTYPFLQQQPTKSPRWRWNWWMGRELVE